METVQYLRALMRSWWLVVLTLIAGGVGGFLVFHGATKLYQSQVRMIVASATPGADAVSAQALTTARAQSLAQIASTDPAVNAAYKQAGDPAAGANVTAGTSNSFVTVSVSSTDPQTAYRIARAYPKTLISSANAIGGTTGTPYKLNVVSDAYVPSDYYSPDWKKDIGIGLAAGLVLGLALAVLRETLNRTLRDSDALSELTGLVILGTVPKSRGKVLLPARTEPRSARAESYRQIRTSLLTRTTQRPLTIAVTSSSLGEGKTSVACNVAAIFSRAGHKVAIVDADLRRPRVASFFELTPNVGLADVLMGLAALDEVIIGLDEGNLAVIPAGRMPADPSELLGSEIMIQVLDDLAAKYEFVIVDTPPVLPVTDALIIGPLVDGMLFVSKLQGTTEDRITRALQSIERVNAEILGVIPNQAAVGADRAYGYAYQYKAQRRQERQQSTPEHGSPVPADPALLDTVSHVERGGRRHPRQRDAAPIADYDGYDAVTSVRSRSADAEPRYHGDVIPFDDDEFFDQAPSVPRHQASSDPGDASTS